MKNAKMQSFIDQIKNLNFSGAMQSVKDAPVDWSQALLFFGSGFLTGFLFKRYCKMFFVSLAVGILLIWVLDHFFHIINWQTVNSLLGTNPAQQIDTIFNSLATWIANNLILTVSFLIGSCLGIFFI